MENFFEARLRNYEESLFWLDDAMIVNICYNATEPSIDLKLNMDQIALKCYRAASRAWTSSPTARPSENAVAEPAAAPIRWAVS